MIQTFSSTIRRREMDAVLTCMVDEKLGPGELNAKLIQSVKESIGCDGAVAFRSPAIALSYALKALSLEEGSAILISALAPAWHYSAVKNSGYKPVIIDVDEETGLMSNQAVSFGVKNGGRVILVHETMGIVPDLDSLSSFGIPVIEDISQSFGASVVKNQNQNPEEETAASASGSEAPVKAGMCGVYTILGMEENDTITSGGGAVLIAPKRREWIVLKKITDEAPVTDILTDFNCALGFVQVKEFLRNEDARKTIFDIFQKALRSGKNKTFLREMNEGSTIWSFPVVLEGSFKDARQYASRKDVEIKPAYENSVISVLDELEQGNFIHAKSLFLRTVLFPLYPRLGSESAAKIAKVLGTLP